MTLNLVIFVVMVKSHSFVLFVAVGGDIFEAFRYQKAPLVFSNCGISYGL